MPEHEFLLFVRPLNRLKIRYMIGGSVAVSYYGEPRLTYDVDIVVFLADPDVQRLGEAFPQPDFYFPPPETVLAEMRREQGGHFNIIHTATSYKADIYPSTRHELDRWSYSQRRQIQFEGESVTLAPPECVIIRKLEYYRDGGSDKHLRDIRSILAISGGAVDRSTVNEWVHRLNLESQWRLAES